MHESANFRCEFGFIGGRRRHNACRRFRATRRRMVIARLLMMRGLYHGVRTDIAQRLGVTVSMACRDVEVLLHSWRDPTYADRRRAEETAARRLRHRTPMPSGPADSPRPAAVCDTIRRL
jgi:hypothetical protein